MIAVTALIAVESVGFNQPFDGENISDDKSRNCLLKMSQRIPL
jgi:hypothetical protein